MDDSRPEVPATPVSAGQGDAPQPDAPADALRLSGTPAQPLTPPVVPTLPPPVRQLPPPASKLPVPETEPAAKPAARGGFIAQHGAAWVAALAAVAGVVLTAIVALGGGDRGRAPAPSVSEPPVAAERTRPPVTGSLPLATSNEDVVELLRRADLPEGEAHEFTTLTTVDGQIRLDAPVTWDDVDLASTWTVGEGAGLDVGTVALAAPDIERLYETTIAPGVFVAATGERLGQDLQDLADSTSDLWARCTTDGPGVYRSGDRTGVYEILGPCGEGPIAILELTTRDADDRLVRVQRFMASHADVEAAQRILDSIEFDPDGLASPRPGDVVVP